MSSDKRTYPGNHCHDKGRIYSITLKSPQTALPMTNLHSWPQASTNMLLVNICQLFFFFFFFSCSAAYGVPKPGIRCDFLLSCSNTRFLTHCARPGIESVVPELQSCCQSHCAKQELQRLHF